MFGIAVASMSSLSDEEKARYKSVYCGLCMALKRDYGQVSRLVLNYDLAFLVLLYDSLYEPAEERGRMRCVSHPARKEPFSVSEFSSYCAGLSVALAYHKCLDDISDDDSKAARIGQMALSRAYGLAKDNLPSQCEVVEASMETIREIEADPGSSSDEASIAFGQMLGFLMEAVPAYFPDLWSGTLNAFGCWLGRFIYMMDAAVDFEQDARSGSYNPFVRIACKHVDAGSRQGHVSSVNSACIEATPDSMVANVAPSSSRAKADGLQKVSPDIGLMRDALGVLIGRACDEFERLPLVQDANLMRSVLYQGVWQKFNKEYCPAEDQVEGSRTAWS